MFSVIAYVLRLLMNRWQVGYFYGQKIFGTWKAEWCNPVAVPDRGSHGEFLTQQHFGNSFFSCLFVCFLIAHVLHDECLSENAIYAVGI